MNKITNKFPKLNKNGVQIPRGSASRGSNRFNRALRRSQQFSPRGWFKDYLIKLQKAIKDNKS